MLSLQLPVSLPNLAPTGEQLPFSADASEELRRLQEAAASLRQIEGSLGDEVRRGSLASLPPPWLLAGWRAGTELARGCGRGRGPTPFADAAPVAAGGAGSFAPPAFGAAPTPVGERVAAKAEQVSAKLMSVYSPLVS